MLEQKVDYFLRRHHIDLKNKGIIVGVSGGPDSLALLYFLWTRREVWNLRVVAVHVDHMFRGIESANEAKFVEQFCTEHDIPFHTKQIDVPAYMSNTKKSAQVAARECRYQFFQEVMTMYEFPFLALGHHGDDQIETMLMRLTRGSTGLARTGISWKRPFLKGEIIRPFLCLAKQEIIEYCNLNQLYPRFDPSNEKDLYSRNRFRKQVLPFLKKENPRVHEQFQRFSEELQEDERLLQELALEKVKNAIEMKKDEVVLDIDSFTTMPMPLQRRGIQLILNYLYQEKLGSLSAIHINQLTTLIHQTHPSGSLDFPNGLRITRAYYHCYFRFKQVTRRPYRMEITSPSVVQLPNGSKLSVEYSDNTPKAIGLDQLVLDVDDYSFPFIIRSRKNGDRMSLKGMKGTKKIKDIFIDQKIPIHNRDEWPIVTDHEDRILWLPGIKHSFIPVIDKKNTRYLLFTYIRNEIF